MFTPGCIQAAIGQHQALHGLAADKVQLQTATMKNAEPHECFQFTES
jgi:hypothetical protein